MILRPGVVSDVDDIKALGDVDPDIGKHVRSGNVFVAQDGNRLVAAIVAVPEHNSRALASMVVREDLRRAGIGKTLVKHVASCCKVRLVAVSSEEAQPFWESCGFRPTMRVMEMAL